MADARRWQFELKTGITSFLDSALFPVCLILIITAVGLTAGGIRRHLRRRGQTPLASSRLQFTVSRLLCVTAGICLFLGIAHWSVNGGFSFAMVTAASLMAAEFFRHRVSRRFAAGVLAMALSYTFANFGLYFFILQSQNPSLIFDQHFVLTAGILGPLLTVVALVAFVFVRPAIREKPPWTGLTGLALWMCGVGVANLHFIAMASAAC